MPPPSEQTPRGSKNRKNSQKTEQTPQGALISFCDENTSRVRCKRPGAFISRFFERKAPWGEPTTREGVRKGPAAEAERDASQHAVSGKARVYVFLIIFIHHFRLYFLLLCLDQWTQHDQANIFFPCGNVPGGVFCPIFSEKRPGGAISELFEGTPRGAFTPFLTVCWKLTGPLFPIGITNLYL